jgi:hypothetical protein
MTDPTVLPEGQVRDELFSDHRRRYEAKIELYRDLLERLIIAADYLTDLVAVATGHVRNAQQPSPDSGRAL